MRILYSHYLGQEDHPAVQMVQAIAGELAALGHDVHIHRSAGSPEESQGGRSAGQQENRTGGLAKRAIRRVRGCLWFAKALARNQAMLRRDRRILQEFQPSVVLARNDAYCFSMAKAAFEAGIPLVTYADAPVAYETRLFPVPGRWHPPGLVETIERWVLRRSQAVVTVSRPAARQLGSYQLSAPIHPIPNGVDPEKFTTIDAPARASLRQQFRIAGSQVIGFSGSFRPFHGLDRLRQLILSTARRDDVEWLLVGDGPGRAELQESVEGRARVQFLGRQPAQLIPGLTALMDIAVAPHAHINGEFYFCPLKILEYAAAGCAVVAGSQGDIPFLLPEETALIVRRDTEEEWVAAVHALLDHPARRARLGQAARQRALNHLTWKRTAEQVAEVLIAAQVVPGSQPQLRMALANQQIPSSIAHPLEKSRGLPR